MLLLGLFVFFRTYIMILVMLLLLLKMMLGRLRDDDKRK